MTVTYHVDQGKPRISYGCSGARSEWGGPHCQHLSGACLDDFVAEQVLSALAPAAVQVSLRAAEQARTDRAALEQIWTQRLERAEINVQRAHRCYRLAEPENRLVVRHLEKDWEEAMAARRQLTEDHHRFQQTTPPRLSEAEEAAITAAAADLPALWTAPSTTSAQRKEVIRSVIDEITVTVQGRSELVEATLHWAGGQPQAARLRRPIQRFEDLSYYPQLTARVLELAEQGESPERIAERVTAEGFRPARGEGPIRYRLVSQILRRAHHQIAHARIPLPVDPAEAPAEHEWWLPELAADVGVTTGTIRCWRAQGLLTGRQESRPPHRWIIHADPAELTALRVRLNRVRGRTTRVHPRFAEETARIPKVQTA